MGRKTLQIQQLNSRMLRFAELREGTIPPIGWIKAIRSAIGMSMHQLGSRLKVSKQAVYDIEKREKDGSITIKSLREIARVMDMQLIYGFIPNDGSLDALIEKRATELATQIVMRTSHTMKLEDQANSRKHIEEAIQERATVIKQEMPKMLWD